MARNSAPPNREILEAALQGLEAQRTRLDEQIAHVCSLMGRRAGRPSRGESVVAEATNHAGAAAGGRKKRVLSPEARKRIAAAQKKRWAAFRKGQ
jgi:hypothetical protein